MSLLKATLREFMDDEAPRMAAALSYYTVFSLPPMLFLVTMLAGAVWDPSEIQGLLTQEIQRVIGPEAARQIREMIEQVDDPATGGVFAVGLGIAALLFGATGAFAQLQASLNKAWGVESGSDHGPILGLLVRRVVSFGMILIAAFLLLVSLVISTVLTAVGSNLVALLPAGVGPPVVWAIEISLSLLVVTLLFMAMYRVLPDADIAWRDVWHGALATAVLFVVGKFALGFYIGRSDPGSVYGAAGSLAVILIWIYYSAMIFLLGAEFTQVYSERRGRGINSR